MYAAITNKLAQDYTALPASIRDIVNRSRITGLHKVAAHLYAKPEFGLKEAITELGSKLAYAHLKQQKIASGLKSLRQLHEDKTVKLSQMARIGPKGVKSLMPTAARNIDPMASGTAFGGQHRMEVPAQVTRPARRGIPEESGFNRLPTASR